MGTGRTVGTIGGAAAGTAVMPGVGTVVGGLAGGLIGGLFDGDEGPPPPDRSNFQFGKGNAMADRQRQTGREQQAAQNQKGYTQQRGFQESGAAAADQARTDGQTAAYRARTFAGEAQATANGRGQGALDQGNAQARGLQQQADTSYGRGDAAQGRTATLAQSDVADQQRQLAALGGMQGNVDQLTAMGTAPMGQSYAEAQLRGGQDAAMQQSLAMARSGRTMGSGAAAMQQAQAQNAATNQVTNQQAAVARIQEEDAYRQRQLAALNGAQQGQSAIAGQAANIRGANDNLSLQNAQLTQAQQGVNNQTSQVYNSVAAQQAQQAMAAQQQGQSAALSYDQLGNQTGLAYDQMGAQQGLAYDQMGNQTKLGYDQLGAQQYMGFNAAGQQADQFYAGQSQNTYSSQLQADMAYENLKAGNNIAGMNADKQEQASTMGMLGSLGGAAMMMSDRDAKKNIKPANREVTWGPLGRAMGFGGDDEEAEAKPAHQPRLVGKVSTTYADPRGVAMTRQYQDQFDRARLSRELAALQDGSDRQFDSGLEPERTGFAPANDVQMGSPAMAPANEGYGHSADLYGGDPWGSGNPDPRRASDERSKREIASLRSELDRTYAALRPPDTDALDEAQTRQGGSVYGARRAPPTARFPDVDLRPARGYSYEYKEPERHGEGRFYGPMAQDLERTPAGASTVRRGPDGTKMVDTSRLSLVNTSAISEQQRRVDELERQLAALRQPDTAALDESYARARAGGY